MKVAQTVLGPVQTNCYFAIGEDGTTAVIDPADRGKQIYQAAQKEGLRIQGILLTHGHFDHIGGVDELRELTGAPVYLHQADQALPGDGGANLSRMFGQPALTCQVDHLVKDGDKIAMGDLEFAVLHTPGHTPGSCVYLVEDAMFSGDTLFAGSIGRTDLPGGNPDAMTESLRRLANLEWDYRIFPGHGERSVLSQELLHNPYLANLRDREKP